MIAIKCVTGKIIGLTNCKKELLDNEYSEFNRLAYWVSQCEKEGIDEFAEYSFIKNKFKLYSLTKVQALRNCLRVNKEQPLMITKQSVKVVVNDNRLTPLWVRIAVYGVRSGIWLPVKTSRDKVKLIKENKTCGVNIKKKGNDYFINITIQKEVVMRLCSNILAVDLGERYMAVVSGTAWKQPLFLGKSVRGIRRHYAWLRRRLGHKKLLKKIKSVKHKECNVVNSILHVISRKIVEVASITNSAIVLGNLKGIRNSAKKKGKRLNRIVANMPYFKLTQMVI